MEGQYRELEVNHYPVGKFEKTVLNIIIVGGLFGCLFPWDMVADLFNPHIKAKINQTKATMTGFIMAMRNYKEKSGRWPLELFKEEHAWQRTQGAVVDLLMGNYSATNQGNVQFFDPPLAKDHHYGIFHDERSGDTILVDPWGTSYYFIIDLNGHHKLPNPDPRDKEANPFLESSIIVFSAGPDRDINTWDDNVLSWK